MKGSPLNRANLRAAYLVSCSSCVIISSPHIANGQADDQSWIDNEAVICTLTIKSMPNGGSARSEDMQEDVIGENINIFTELSKCIRCCLISYAAENPTTVLTLCLCVVNEKNGVFLNVGDRYETGQEVFMLQGFACGRIFNVSILHSLMSNVSVVTAPHLFFHLVAAKPVTRQFRV